MFLPPETLADVALLSLVFSGMSRILLIVPSCVAILRLFGVEFREGIRLFRSLEVPGLGAFVRQELVLATLPFIALGSFLLYIEEDLLLTDLTNPQRVVTFAVFILWIVLDVFRSHTAGAHLRMMASETKSFGKKWPSALLMACGMRCIFVQACPKPPQNLAREQRLAWLKSGSKSTMRKTSERRPRLPR